MDSSSKIINNSRSVQQRSQRKRRSVFYYLRIGKDIKKSRGSENLYQTMERFPGGQNVEPGGSKTLGFSEGNLFHLTKNVSN